MDKPKVIISLIVPIPNIFDKFLYTKDVTKAISKADIIAFINTDNTCLPPKGPILFLKFINNNATVTKADVLVARASPASCILDRKSVV